MAMNKKTGKNHGPFFLLIFPFLNVGRFFSLPFFSLSFSPFLWSEKNISLSLCLFGYSLLLFLSQLSPLFKYRERERFLLRERERDIFSLDKNRATEREKKTFVNKKNQKCVLKCRPKKNKRKKLQCQLQKNATLIPISKDP